MSESQEPLAIETSLFAKLFDLSVWLLQCVEKFPRAQRYLLATPLMDTFYACHRELIRARKMKGNARFQALVAADVELEQLRMQWRAAHERKCISTRQYEYGAALINEVGRILGGKLRS
jgi:hypothetical protein